ncbi:MAG TPA: iron-sulfur cluster repair di-iron protein [Firmicutes bacterium]|nr:iron-sulfur cluster repair di-iron protein [Bacillota bacterium]
MSTINEQKTVAELVTERPDRTRIFERLGIDYCCGGRKTLAQACQEKGLDVRTVVATLQAVEEAAEAQTRAGVGAEAETEAEAEAGATGWTAASLAELCDHIVATHHRYLYEELPRLEALLARVVEVHEERHPELLEVQGVFGGLRDELVSHLMKEEQVLFPTIRELETRGQESSGFRLGSLVNPIRVMEMEHESAGQALAKMRELTGGYAPPADACNSYRALLTALAWLEQDLHMHIHKENNILFPRALAAEQGQ